MLQSARKLQQSCTGVVAIDVLANCSLESCLLACCKVQAPIVLQSVICRYWLCTVVKVCESRCCGVCDCTGVLLAKRSLVLKTVLLQQ
jgi:hypothetical protein